MYKDDYDKLVEQHGGSGDGNPALIKAMMAKQRFVLPDGASFWDLYEHRYQAGNGERIDKALHAIKEANGTKLKNAFQDISFNTDDSPISRIVMRSLLLIMYFGIQVIALN